MSDSPIFLTIRWSCSLIRETFSILSKRSSAAFFNALVILPIVSAFLLFVHFGSPGHPSQSHQDKGEVVLLRVTCPSLRSGFLEEVPSSARYDLCLCDLIELFIFQLRIRDLHHRTFGNNFVHRGFI